MCYVTRKRPFRFKQISESNQPEHSDTVFTFPKIMSLQGSFVVDADTDCVDAQAGLNLCYKTLSLKCKQIAVSCYFYNLIS